MNDPQDILRRLAAVRRAWRRTAVLAGCAVAAVEAMGVIVLFLIVDLVFVSSAGAHTALATLAWTAVAALFVWHGGRPLLRPISDREIALFIEERNPEFRGALLTAIEFSGQGVGGAQSEMVALAVERAIGEAGTRNPVSAVRLVTLRKYVIAAACLLLGWLVAILAVPASVKGRLAVALNPLADPTIPLGPDGKPLDPTVAAVLAGMDKAAQAPKELRIEIDPGEPAFRIKRGEALQLTAICNRRPDSAPRILVRSQADPAAAWRAIDMQPAERANGFGGSISDISEDLVFCVASGDVRTAEKAIAVYDPLTLVDVQGTVIPPAYLGGEPATAAAPDGDLTVPEGGKAALRFTANRALAKGEMRWADGSIVAGTVDTDGALVLAFDAPAGTDGTTFTWTVRDADGAELASQRPARLQIEPDRAPTVDIESPVQPVSVTARAEIPVQVKAWDDHGLTASRLDWTRHDPEGKAVAQGSIPLTAVPAAPAAKGAKKVDEEKPGTVHLRASIALEALLPAPSPHDIIIWSVAVSDARQQVSTSTLGVISVQDFEQWQVWQFVPPMEGGAQAPAGVLLDVLNATWDVVRDGAARRIKPDEVPARCAAIAKQMESGGDKAAPATAGAALISYLPFPPPPPAWTPAQEELNRKLTPLVQQGHDALVAGDAARAKDILQIGVALVAAYVLTDTASNLVMAPQQQQAMPEAAGAAPPNQARLALESARLEAQKAALEEQAKREAELRLAKAATDTMRRLAAIKKDHDQVQEQVVAMGAKPDDEAVGLAAAIADRERKLAERTRAVADSAAGEAAFKGTPLAALAAGINTAETAMRNGATALAANGAKDAAHQVKTADQALNEALVALKQFSIDAMSESLETTEKNLADALARQREIIDRSTVLAAVKGEMDLAQTRETTAVAATQARLKGETDALVLAADGLPRIIESWAASEVLAKVDAALKTLKSGKPATKMVNSIIELQESDLRKALAQQALAEQTLDQALKSIREAMALVALDRAQLMEQLKKELTQAKADLTATQPPPPADAQAQAPQDAAAKADAEAKQDAAAKADAAKQDAAAKADAAAKQDAADKAKADAAAKQDAAAKAAKDAQAKQDAADKAKADAAAKQDAAAKAAEQAKADAAAKQDAAAKADAAAQAKKDAAAKQDQAAKAKQDAAAKADAAAQAKKDAAAKQDQAAKAKQDAAAKQNQAAKQDQAKKDAPTTAEAHRAADRLANLAKLLNKADIEAKELKDMAADPKALAQRLAQDPAAAAEALRIIDRLTRAVEQEVASTADSSRILSQSRGEVPPQYRQLVNRYFESMSRYGQKGGTAP